MTWPRRILASVCLILSLTGFFVGETWLGLTSEHGYILAAKYQRLPALQKRTREILEDETRGDVEFYHKTAKAKLQSELDDIKLLETKRLPWEWPFGVGYVFGVVTFLLLIFPGRVRFGTRRGKKDVADLPDDWTRKAYLVAKGP